MTKLTTAQSEALRAAMWGPLFRRGRSWGRPEVRCVAPKTAEKLIERGLLERAVTRHGVPMVRLTDTGRAAIGATTRAGGFRRRADLEAEAVPVSLADRIAP